MELRRIFNYKFCLVILLMGFVNMLLFVRENLPLREASQVYDEMLRNSLTYIEKSESVKQAAIAGYKEYADSKEINDLIKNARIELIKNAEYVDGYNTLINEKIQDCQNQLKLGIFADKNSFEYLNILKTMSDLRQVKNTDITLGNGIWLDRLLEFKYINIFIFIGVLMVVYSFFNEEKNGLVYIINAASNGRKRLYFWRLGILFAASIVISLIFYVITSIISVSIHGGIEGVFGLVSSDSKYLLSGFGMNRMEYVFVIAMLSGFGCFAMGIILWLLMSLFANGNIGLVLFALLYGFEFILYNLISRKSIFRCIKYINLVSLNNIGTNFTKYENWGNSGWIASAFETSLIFALIIVLIVGGAAFYKNVYRRAEKHITLLEKGLEKLQGLVMRLIAQSPVLIKELYKLLFSQKMIVAVAILMFLAIDMEVGNGVVYNTEMSFYRGFYEEADGLMYGEELLQIQDKYEQDFITFAEELPKNTPGYEMLIALRSNMLEGIKSKIQYVRDKNEQGIEAVIKMPYEYEWAFGKRQLENQYYLLFLCLTATAILSGTFYSYEKRNGMITLIRTSNLRRKWLVKKYLTVVLASFVFCAIVHWNYYSKLFSIYEISDMNFTIKSLELYWEFPLDISLKTFIMLDLLMKLVALAIIVILIGKFTAHMSYVISMLASMVVTVPQILYMLGLTSAVKFSLCTYISGIIGWNQVKL